MDKERLAQLPENSEKAYRKIQERIEEGNLLLAQQIDSDEELKEAKVAFSNWSEHNKMILSLLFDSSLIADEYAKLHADVVPRPSYDSQSFIHEFPRLQHQVLQSYVRQYQKQITTQIKYLQRIGDQFELPGEPLFTPRFFGDDVFIVHGQDEGAKYDVARFVEKLGLTATMLGDQPNRGLTLFDKFEQYASNAGFAIVLLTAVDEFGHQLKAHQNLIFELGYIIGQLGRERVCLLFKGEVEMLPNLSGVFYVHMDSNDDWKLKLAREMRNVRLPIDMNELFLDR